MKVKVGGEGDMSAPEVGLTTVCYHSIDVQHAVAVRRTVISASSTEGNLVEMYTWTVDIEWVAIVSRSAVVASSGEGSLLFRRSRNGYT